LILAFDTYYYGDNAKTVCLAFEKWSDAAECRIYAQIKTGVNEYEPGAFYKRELPCILSLLDTIQLENVEAIIIDGFVFLDDNNTIGLGGHLFNTLNKKIPVIGVAKTNFATIQKNKRAVYRGQSEKPLYITAISMDIELAADCIKSMHGDFRMPTLLKKLDTYTKEVYQASEP
jgi:deoxyribonuclease V